jgi:hypothetical protein
MRKSIIVASLAATLVLAGCSSQTTPTVTHSTSTADRKTKPKPTQTESVAQVQAALVRSIQIKAGMILAMAVTITLTTITKKQWASIGKVALWLLGSAAVGVGTSYVAKDVDLAAPVTVAANLVGVALSKFFTQEETVALDELPSDLRAPVQAAAKAATAEVLSKIVPVPPIEPAYSPSVEAPVVPTTRPESTTIAS